MLAKSLSIEDIKNLVIDEFAAVDQLIQSHLHSEVSIIEDISQHIIKSGGKRLRPLIVLLMAKAQGYQGADHIALAAVVEFLHTATLLHDDVVDDSKLRRGQQTANTLWGNAASVLVGDFLYSRTFEIMTQLQNNDVMAVLAKTTNAIAEGEVLQLVKRNDPTTNEAHYMQVICNKTARLFQTAAEVTAMICHRSDAEQTTLAQYGLHLGMAFQLVDDVLDYSGDAATLGKNIGDDLAEGKATLPLIHAMANANPQRAAVIKKAIQQGGMQDLDIILEAMTEAKSLDYTFQKAEDHIEQAIHALSILPDSTYRAGLISLAHFALRRQY